LDDFNDERFHATGIGAILIFEGQICNCFTVPLSIDNSAYLSQLSKIVAGVNSQKKLRESLYRSKSVVYRQNYC
ncbi:MAG: hypothetical protein MR943_01095, partial [Lachnobacterium sp.]|nr:hypothetical protein [Lachnobacterium sp.]